MDCVKSDNCSDSDVDIGYAKLVDKHINEYQRIFDENERNLNQYKYIDESVVTITGDNNVAKKNSVDIAVKSVPNEREKQQQTTTSSRNEENSIYSDLYKEWSLNIRCRKQRTHMYACLWYMCRYKTTDYKLLKHHLYNEHIKTQLYVNYSRSFVELNVYQYKCLHCDYLTELFDKISRHICYEWLCNECGRRFHTKRQLTCHVRQHKRWKCYANHCGKRFATKDELTAHKKESCLVNIEQCSIDKGLCRASNIRKYYQKRKVITKRGTRSKSYAHRYVCLWSECSFEIYNSERAIQRHIHTTHTRAQT